MSLAAYHTHYILRITGEDGTYNIIYIHISQSLIVIEAGLNGSPVFIFGALGKPLQSSCIAVWCA